MSYTVNKFGNFQEDSFSGNNLVSINTNILKNLKETSILSTQSENNNSNIISFLETVNNSKPSNSILSKNRLPPSIIFEPPLEQSFKQKIKKYCELLYKYLKSTNTCFIKGAFVIDDANGNLKKLLSGGIGKEIVNYKNPTVSELDKLLDKYESDTKIIEMFRNFINKNRTKEKKKIKDELVRLSKLLASHKDFGPQKNDVCNSGSGICEINLTDVDDVVDLFCDDKYKEDKYLDPKYESVRQLKKNIKFYFFNNSKEGGVKDRFVFFKLELDPTKSWAHLVLAFKRYKMGMTETDPLPIRREDCRKDKNGCICKNDNCKFKFETDPEGILINKYTDNKSTSCIKNRDEHTRVGDEFFVNVHINDTIVEMIEKNIPNYEFNPVTCSFPRKGLEANNTSSTTGTSGRFNNQNQCKLVNGEMICGSRESLVGGSKKKRKSIKKNKKNNNKKSRKLLRKK